MSSAVEIVDQLMVGALAGNASDIHCESVPEGLRIRYRIDGILCDHTVVPHDIASQVLARIKVLARVDVAEKRLPQDGKFSVTHQGRSVDVRVATFPGHEGEKAVLRILDRPFDTITLSALGFSLDMQKTLRMLASRATGFFLVTGPTGSGKTTTLYALLTAIHSPEKNVTTLEDPIEYTILGVTQGQVQPDIGFTFARGIRALLRQDPDIIMVGEIRDTETAEVAIQAALTGHLVLSTLHTNDAPGALIRLLDMGIPAFLINATLTGVLAQRLVRVLCPGCRYEAPLDEFEIDFVRHAGVKIKRAYKARGCDACRGRGYRGRTGIYELVVMTPTLHALMTMSPSYDALVQKARDEGMLSLVDDAVKKIEEGITSVREFARVIW